MPDPNLERALVFSNSWISCTLILDAKARHVVNSIVVNLSTTPAIYRAGKFRGSIPPFQSKKLIDCEIEDGKCLGLFTQVERENLGGLALSWRWLGDVLKSFSQSTPLYLSPQDDIAEVNFNAGALFSFSGQDACRPQAYRLKLNLWYAPPQTDCSIHFEHSFLEVHTQLVGLGHMQKFRGPTADTLFEDVICAPGATHEAFFQLSDEAGFHYPQHRYFAQTECVWMAIEFHPVGLSEGNSAQ